MVQTIACIGAGFVGGPLAVVIAYNCPGIRVIVADANASRINAWINGTPPFYEPGLDEMLATVQRRETSALNLEFNTATEDTIQRAELIFLCVDTPTKSFGEGRGCAADLTSIQRVARMIARVATGDKIIVEKSTIPCGTAEMLHKLLRACGSPEARCEVLSNPEFLAEGTAIENLQRPSRVLIGCAQTQAGRRAGDLLASIYETWVPSSSILRVDTWASELAKLASNAMLAQRISNINSLSAICEVAGTIVSIDSVATACGLDPRIGPHMLRAGLGWGGGCFQKDILCLVYIARSLHLHDVADYWQSVITMNESQQNRFLQRIIAFMYGNVSGRSIAVLGMAFKENTSDTKNSPAITVVRGLLEEGAKVSVYDPRVRLEDIQLAVGEVDTTQLQVCQCPYEACSLADAIVLATGWDQFQTPPGESMLNHGPPSSQPDRSGWLDWPRIAHAMEQPKFVFDGRNFLDGAFLTKLGCRYVRVGSSTVWNGAAGFLGSNMVDYLLRQGVMVIGVDNYSTGSTSNLCHILNSPLFTMIRHDIQTHLPDLPPLQSIYHLACPASPPQYQKDPVDTLDTAYLGTRNLLSLAQKQRCRILLSSTSEIYGSPQVHPQPESYWGHVNPYGPRACYDEGKRAAEGLAWAFQQAPRNVDVRIARIFNTYGPRLAPEDGRVVSNFVAAALDNKPLIITGDGSATRSFQYVDDCVRGLVTLMEADSVPGPVNIGNDVEVTLTELANTVGRVVKQVTGCKTTSIEYRSSPVDDPPKRRPDLTLAKRTLGWAPVISLREGLIHTVRWQLAEKAK
ncbi:UDP-glucose dehydrogenase [Aspergillus affinis]|uniref:UDP-glucose dehydrogenase n=1 Tax=Aspergillus affinis TaxID=1070780 RepID=UPI0022FE32B3|nr:UDP-glucose 6-dehydrogenase 4 [Aspergillus affinis]KAI9046209.1 UDP-glucose 6-dehydrogenase 4 [Aspergillus affinis]